MCIWHCESIPNLLLNTIAILLTDKTDDLAYNRMLVIATNPPLKTLVQLTKVVRLLKS